MKYFIYFQINLNIFYIKKILKLKMAETIKMYQIYEKLLLYEDNNIEFIQISENYDLEYNFNDIYINFIFYLAKIAFKYEEIPIQYKREYLDACFEYAIIINNDLDLNLINYRKCPIFIGIYEKTFNNNNKFEVNDIIFNYIEFIESQNNENLIYNEFITNKKKL